MEHKVLPITFWALELQPAVVAPSSPGEEDPNPKLMFACC